MKYTSLTDYLRAGALAVTLLLGCGAKEPEKTAPDRLPPIAHSLESPFFRNVYMST